MDFEPDAEQTEIQQAIDALLERHAGPARAIQLAAHAGYDQPLEDALHEAGFLGLATAGAGPLEAGLLVESAARAGAVASVAAAALVAPGLEWASLPRPIALADASEAGPVRFAAHARTLLLRDGDQALAMRLAEGDAAPVRSEYGYPMGALPTRSLDGEPLAAGSGATLLRWWRVALALEIAGTCDGALAITTAYLKDRRQFGRAIGSFQAVQHRLAECAIAIEGVRWLAREAAYHGAPDEAAAVSAAEAARVAQLVFAETHQLSGAIGYTREHDLHVFSMRLQTLRLELGGVGAHRRAVATSRFGAGAARG